MPEFQNSQCRHITHPGRCAAICRSIGWIIPQVIHQSIEVGNLVRIEIDQRAICSITDCFFLVRLGMFRSGTSQRVAEARANSHLIVSCPGFIHTGMNNREHACNDWRAEMAILDHL